mmetsp:Transcript_45632/g.121043  ORF Transcript_45632/g.121043 Transcript_45632/m.121043 type:complete len:242 (+) Transcript_45632:213-938(+)
MVVLKLASEDLVLSPSVQHPILLGVHKERGVEDHVTHPAPPLLPSITHDHVNPHGGALLHGASHLKLLLCGALLDEMTLDLVPLNLSIRSFEAELVTEVRRGPLAGDLALAPHPEVLAHRLQDGHEAGPPQHHAGIADVHLCLLRNEVFYLLRHALCDGASDGVSSHRPDCSATDLRVVLKHLGLQPQFCDILPDAYHTHDVAMTVSPSHRTEKNLKSLSVLSVQRHFMPCFLAREALRKH